ncbi:hypothetical protein SAMN04489859_100535 [Paracoccus alcaliphilus]|uniref:Uncharacterized protein n=1 Tax=Paracoccus alcaliphilus TaxID=34002 RepID=A0A1H8FVT2_9RHOB|nr:hypothetical protein SAMN04489859_100535 [Paracoccus alcaliphilus]
MYRGDEGLLHRPLSGAVNGGRWVDAAGGQSRII